MSVDLDERARTGLKKGGGGQQQVFAGHGKYGTAYDLAVARAEQAKQRKAAVKTYTLDAEKDGQYFEDHGLTAEQVAAAKANAPRLGITILSVTEEVAVDPADLAPFGVTPPPSLSNELVEKGGFTLDPHSGSLVRHGVAVAIEGHTEIMSAGDFVQADKGREFVRQYIHKMAKANPPAGTMVGGWYDREHDEVVLDWSQVFDSRAAGIRAGRERNQMAVYDLATDTEISTGGTGSREEILSAQAAAEARDVGRREAEQAIRRDVARGAGPPGRRGLRRDGSQPQPVKDALTTRLIELQWRAKTGLKKGGGGQQQVFAGHGKYGTAYDLAVARAEQAKQRKPKPTLNELLDEAEAKIAKKAGPMAELAKGLHAPVAHRMEFFAKHVPDGPEARALAAIKAGTPLGELTGAERYLVELYQGDEWALNNLASSKLLGFNEGEVEFSDDPFTKAAIDESIKELEKNERYQKAVAQFGPVPMIQVKTLGDRSILGQYGSDVMAISAEKPSFDTTPRPMELDQFNVDPSMNGVLRHEYGHHIESLLTSEQKEKWLKAYDKWGFGDLGQMGLITAQAGHAKDPNSPIYGDLDRGLSLYGRTNEKEGFAETFNLVTRLDYDRTKVRARMKPMVYFMEDLLDFPADERIPRYAEPVEEERAKTGQKKGAGGKPQRFGQHGRYQRIGQWDAALARSPSYDEATTTNYDEPNAPKIAAELAGTIVENARQFEPAITEDVTAVAKLAGATMYGLEYRIKENAGRISDKILERSAEDGVTLAESAGKVSDPVRFTFHTAPGRYVASFNIVADELTRRGYKLRVKNYWPPGDAYNGVNVAATSPAGVPVEVQFHTPMSQAIKDKVHLHYEEFRKPTTPQPRRVELWRTMVKTSDAQAFPPNWDKIPGAELYPPPAGYVS